MNNGKYREIYRQQRPLSECSHIIMKGKLSIEKASFQFLYNCMVHTFPKLFFFVPIHKSLVYVRSYFMCLLGQMFFKNLFLPFTKFFLVKAH